MPVDEAVKQRFEGLDKKADAVAASRRQIAHPARRNGRWLSEIEPPPRPPTSVVDHPAFKAWGTSVLDLLQRAFGKDGDFYREFSKIFGRANDEERHFTQCRAVFNAAREQYLSGLLATDQGQAAAPQGTEEGLSLHEGADGQRQQDRVFARIAVDQARKCRTEGGAARPLVGAVVVKNGKELGRAFRGELAPGDHGEFTLLEKKLKDAPLAGATVYTTLEPCTTRGEGKVPCVRRLIERKVGRVVIGTLDPNRSIQGEGVQMLREAGVAVDLFPKDLMDELEDLNREFFRTHRRAAASGRAPEPASAPTTEEIKKSIFVFQQGAEFDYEPTTRTLRLRVALSILNCGRAEDWALRLGTIEVGVVFFVPGLQQHVGLTELNLLKPGVRLQAIKLPLGETNVVLQGVVPLSRIADVRSVRADWCFCVRCDGFLVVNDTAIRFNVRGYEELGMAAPARVDSWLSDNGLDVPRPEPEGAELARPTPGEVLTRAVADGFIEIPGWAAKEKELFELLADDERRGAWFAEAQRTDDGGVLLTSPWSTSKERNVRIPRARLLDAYRKLVKEREDENFDPLVG